MTPATIDLENLLLDPENPRLKTVSPESEQDDLARALYEEMSVDEVAMSIAANGYFPQEPLIVISERNKAGRKTANFIVVEGNRRLAAVKLLCSAALRNQIGATDLPDISAEAKRKLSKLPCHIYESKEDLWQFLGFRHINGVKPWDPFSKASYIAEVHELYNVPLNKIAQQIGDRHSTVKRLYRGLMILRQGENAGFNPEDRKNNRFFFSHLYTAADQVNYQKFLGIDPELSLKKNPVPAGKRPQLKELLVWLYGSKSQDKEPVVIKQNPDVERLGSVISDPAALAALRTGASLKRAHEVSQGDVRRFEDSIYSALEDLKQANGLFADGFRKNDGTIREAIDAILVQAERLIEQVAKTSSKKAK